MTVIAKDSSFTSQPDVPAALRELAVHTSDLSMTFGKERALHQLNLNIPQGAIYALVGPNGAGKSTLIKLLLNILHPSAGAATVLGKPCSRMGGEDLTRIGYVSENQEIPEWMTVTALLRYLRPFYPRWDVALEAQLVDQFSLPLHRKLKHLSRGQRMKAALLSVLPYRPLLIVLDEPFSGLDPLVRDELIECLLDRAAQDANPPTILVSSHDLAEVETLASHVGYLDRGNLLFSEDISMLTGRFREVTITVDTKTPSGNALLVPGEGPGSLLERDSYPASWLLPETNGSVMRFVHAHADTEAIHDQIAARFSDGVHVQAEAMSLRSIFLALAKSTRHAVADTRSRA